jgi:hypothetical protein
MSTGCKRCQLQERQLNYLMTRITERAEDRKIIVQLQHELKASSKCMQGLIEKERKSSLILSRVRHSQIAGLMSSIIYPEKKRKCTSDRTVAKAGKPFCASSCAVSLRKELSHH